MPTVLRWSGTPAVLEDLSRYPEPCPVVGLPTQAWGALT